MYKLKKHKFPRRKYILKDNNDLLQLDLGILSDISQYNRQMKYFLLAINCFSRQIFCLPLLNKSKKTVLTAFKRIYKKIGRNFKNIHTDRGMCVCMLYIKKIYLCFFFVGTEFKNKDFMQFCKDKKINLYFAYSPLKCVFAERYIGK